MSENEKAKSMRLIDANELDDKLAKQIMFNTPEHNEGIMYAGYIIAGMPTIDAKPVKHGEWIERKVISRNEAEIVMDEWQSAKCSICGRYHTTPYMYSFYEDNYCPNCGAKMERREE